MESWGFTFKLIFNDLVSKYQQQLDYIYGEYELVEQKEDLQIQLENIWSEFNQ